MTVTTLGLGEAATLVITLGLHVGVQPSASHIITVGLGFDPRYLLTLGLG